jgi:hypothetical protein
LIIGDGGSQHERYVSALASGAGVGVLFTDDMRCPVHVTDLDSALLELGVLIARRDGSTKPLCPLAWAPDRTWPAPSMYVWNAP